MKIIITSILILFYLPPAFGQNSNLIHPEFNSFKGDVYSIPLKMLQKGYGEQVYDYDKIGEIEWNEINISDRHIDDGFPDVKKKIKFGMVLHSTMKIKQSNCYEFILNSDDGSKLWIDGQLIIDNDGDHRMTLKRDSVHLLPGEYDVKIWYFQAYPNRFGFIFDSKNTGLDCREKKIRKKEKPVVEKINFESHFLFNTNEYELKKNAFSKLDSISTIIKNNNPKKIIITGYTDNQGSENYNMELSLRRASSIQTYLIRKINQPNIRFVSRGKGEQNPIATNETGEGRARNRRVEIILE